MWRDIFVTIAQLIVASPGAWKDIDREKRPLNEFLSRFLHPIVGIIALTTFIGGLWLVRDGDVESALKNVIITVVAVYGGYYLAAYALNEAAPRFGLTRNMARFQQFVGYSSVVLYALYIIIPFLTDFFILWVFALYTIHLVNTGAKFFMKVPAGNRVNFSILAAALSVLTPALIQALFSFLLT